MLFSKKELEKELAGNPGVPVSVLSEIHELATSSMDMDPSAMLRRIYGIRINSITREITDSVVIFTVTGTDALGRPDSATGAASIVGQLGQDLANAIKGAETNAKRRFTFSLLGFGFKTEAVHEPSTLGPAQPEPQTLDTPAVNQTPADVVTDARIALNEIQKFSIDVTATTGLGAGDVAAMQQPGGTLEGITTPNISEETISKMHKQSDLLGATAVDSPADCPAPKAPVADLESPTGFFDDEPLQAAAEAKPITVEVPATPAPATPATQAAPSAELDVQDVQPAPTLSDKPTRLQFQKLNERCTKLVRDVLPKSGQKDAPNLLLPFLKKKFGVNDVTQAGVFVWEETLAYLESVTDPKALYSILKGK